MSIVEQLKHPAFRYGFVRGGALINIAFLPFFAFMLFVEGHAGLGMLIVLSVLLMIYVYNENERQWKDQREEQAS